MTEHGHKGNDKRNEQRDEVTAKRSEKALKERAEELEAAEELADTYHPSSPHGLRR
jgi:hypothetical protein